MELVLGVLGGGLILLLWTKHPEVMRVVMMIASALMFIVGVFKAIP